MIYTNTDPSAIQAMEEARTGNYGEEGFYDEYEDVYCPICGELNPEFFYVDTYGDCVGCSECVHKEYSLPY